MALKEIDLGNVRGPSGPTGAKGVSMRLKGAWSSSIAYVNDGADIDLVTSGGNTYACKQSNTNQPVSNSTYWELIAQKGATGAQGQPGATYTHPSTHPASMIAEDSTHRFLTDVERKLIQAWETFKTTGGTIEGALKVVGLLTLEGYSTSATEGYTKLPNGFMLQWGDFTTAGINVNSEINPQRVFPVAFPSTTLIVAPFVKKCVTDLGATLNAEVVIKAVTINSKSAFQTKIKAKEYVSGGVVVGYIALGR